jgi:hypothetical protein
MISGVHKLKAGVLVRRINHAFKLNITEMGVSTAGNTYTY